MPSLEITEVVLVQCNVANNNCQHSSRDLYTFVPNQPFGQLLDVFPTSFIFLETFNSELPHIELLLTDQNFKLVKIENEINITLDIN